MLVAPGAVDITEYFVLRGTDDNLAETGLTITDFDLQYVRSGAAPSAKVDATALAATDSAHADNKAIEIDATDQPGLYRIDWPDAAFAAGVRSVVLTVKCSGVFTEHKEIQIAAPVGVAASVTGAVGSVTGAVGSVTGAVGSVTGNVGGSVGSVTGAVGSVTGNVGGSTASVVGAVGSVTGNVGGSVGSVTGNVSGSVGSVVGSVGGNVDGSVASVTGGVTLAADAIKATSYDESTAFPVKAADAGATQIARVGADGDTLETLSDQIDTIDVSGVADAVWDEAGGDHVAAGSMGKQLADLVPGSPVNLEITNTDLVAES